MRRLYRTEPIDLAITPKRSPDIRKLAGAWNVFSGGLPDALTFIQIDRKYVFTMGAHFTHGFALISIEHPITYAIASEVTAYLSFLFETPIIATLSLKPNEARRTFAGLRRFMRFRGHVPRDDVHLQQLLTERYELAAQAGDGLLRELPEVPRGRVLAFDLPTDHHLRDGLSAYQQALFSVDPAGQLVNAWRAIEATARSLAQRRALLAAMLTARLPSVLARGITVDFSARPFDLVSATKRYLRPHVRRLIAHHGSPEAVMDFFYRERRNPAAHGDHDVLRPGVSVDLAELQDDALLIQLLARYAIHRYYENL